MSTGETKIASRDCKSPGIGYNGDDKDPQKGVQSMEQNIAELKKKLETQRPEQWELIPDIDLYMDQIIAYMKRQHIGLASEEEETLTSSMINNYIKSGVLPRAKGKRYDREHIAYLTAVCLLKQILSVKDTGALLKVLMEADGTEDFYKEYREVVDREYAAVAEELTDAPSREELARMALTLAVSSYAQKYACQRIVEMLEDYSD